MKIRVLDATKLHASDNLDDASEQPIFFRPDDPGSTLDPLKFHGTDGPGHHPEEPPHHPPGGSDDDLGHLKFRTIDGSGNNLAEPKFNSTGSDFTRVGPAHFADANGTPVDGPNPRMISNVVVGGDGADAENPEGLSGMMYAWGQFLDHDLDLNNSDGVHHIDITVPAGDPNFTPGSVIAMTRGVVDPANGNAVNSVTGWLDASMVYGSDATTAASLRLSDGHMKTSAGDNLPIVGGAFAAGDVRAAENPSLTALQTLFVREHNYQVDLLHKEHPTLTGEQLYQEARAIVTAEIENITFSEFLPHLLGTSAITPYHG